MFGLFNKTRRTKEFLARSVPAAIAAFKVQMRYLRNQYGYKGPQYSDFEPMLFINWCYGHAIHNQNISISSIEELKNFVGLACVSSSVNEISPNNLPNDKSEQNKSLVIQWLAVELPRRYLEYNDAENEGKAHAWEARESINFLLPSIRLFSNYFVGKENSEIFMRQWNSSLPELFAEARMRPMFELEKARKELGLK